MRVAFIVNSFPVLSETFIVNQAVGLLERGHQVDIFAVKVGDQTKVHPLVEQYSLLEKTHYLPLVPENMFSRVWNAISLFLVNLIQDPIATLNSVNIFKYGKHALSLRLLYNFKPRLKQTYDIVHCQFGTASFHGIFFRQMHSPKAKLVTTFRGHDISSFISKKGIHVYDELFEIGDLFLTNCEFFKRKVIELGCSPSNIKVLRSGLDCELFHFSPPHFAKGEKVQIVTIGRLVEKKGVEYSIRAIAELAKKSPNIQYTVIGDGPLKGKFIELIQELGVSHIIEIVGWKDQKEITEILGQCHIFIAPSVTAQDGNQDAPINVLKEAMAIGLPVISTYHGGIPELVEDGVSGFLAPERDVNSLVDKLQYLINHPEAWTEMGKAGREFVETHYDLNKLNDLLVEYYRELINTDGFSKSSAAGYKSFAVTAHEI